MRYASIRFNGLCVVGAILGIACIWLQWGTAGWGYGIHTILEGSEVHISPYWGYPQYLWSVVYVLGSLVALITPIGGIFQLAGLSSYIMWTRSDLAVFPAHMPRLISPEEAHLVAGYRMELAFFIAIIGAVLTLASILLPWGKGYSGIYAPFTLRTLSLRERLLAWHLVERKVI